MFRLLIKIIQFKRCRLCLVLLCLMISFSVYSAVKFNTEKRYLYIQPGQSIYSIVRVVYPGMQNQWPLIIKKIVADNPHAFIKRNESKIKVGERIALPIVKLKKPKVVKKKVSPKVAPIVGQVIESKGKTFVISSANKKRELQVKSDIHVGDRIYTGVNAFIRLKMIDDAKIDLRCNSEMLIEAYQLLKGANKSVIRLIKGSIKKITGTIGKMVEDIYEMRTPVATIGVRGTEYAVRVLQQHGCDGSLDVNSKGLFVKVNRGAIDIDSPMEVRAVNQGEVMQMADEKSKLKMMAIDNGVFDKVEVKALLVEKKRSHPGFTLWLILLWPIVSIFRRLSIRAS